jgi:hypothetical protein
MSVDNPGASSGSSTPSPVEERAKQDMNQAMGKVQSDLDAVTQRAAEEARALQQEAKSQLENAKSQLGDATEKAKSFASEQKDFAAQQLTGVAAAISKVADELEGEQATTARYARDLAKNIDRFGRQVEGKDVDELMGMAQQFGRSQPLAFLGAAALAGFVAARFAGASAHRRQTQYGSSGASAGRTSGTSYGQTSAGGTSTGSSAYGQSGTGSSAYGQSGSGSSSYGQGSTGSSTYGQSGTGYTGGGNG